MCVEMTSFVLPHHANSETLHRMFDSFRTRIRTDETPLPNMFNALQQQMGNERGSHHYMIYWPLSKQAFETKRCLYETSVTSIVPEPKAFHFVYITSLLTKLHPKKARFRRCKCVDHSKEVSFDWSEFVYPQFVELLFKRSLLTPSKCPSPMALQTMQFINESLQCHFEIDKQAYFLNNHLHNELFQLSCNELYQKYKNSHLTVFGRENIEELRHFTARRVTKSEYKLQFVINETKIRVSHMKGGGRIVLKKTAVPYVIIASNFLFRPPDNDGATHYQIYVHTSQQHSQLITHTKKYIKSNKFSTHDQPCMIISTSPLTLEFKEGVNSAFILYSPGKCGINLVDECLLEIWNKDQSKCGWPLRYEVNDDYLNRDYTGNSVRYFEKIHSRYYKLFNHPICDHFDMSPPAHGYVNMREDKVIVATPDGVGTLRSLYHEEQAIFNQYGTMLPYGSKEQQSFNRSVLYDELQQLRVYINHDVTHFSNNTTIQETVYSLAKIEYKLNGLCRKNESTPFSYYFMNKEKTFILFIPVY